MEPSHIMDNDTTAKYAYLLFYALTSTVMMHASWIAMSIKFTDRNG